MSRPKSSETAERAAASLLAVEELEPQEYHAVRPLFLKAQDGRLFNVSAIAALTLGPDRETWSICALVADHVEFLAKGLSQEEGREKFARLQAMIEMRYDVVEV